MFIHFINETKNYIKYTTLYLLYERNFNLNVSLLKHALIINNCAVCIVWYVIEDIHFVY